MPSKSRRGNSVVNVGSVLKENFLCRIIKDSLHTGEYLITIAHILRKCAIPGFLAAMATKTIQNTTRNGILNTVDLLLGEIGYAKLNVQDIADRAGISRRTFYGYFPSKEAATLACLDRRIAELVQQLEVIAAQPQPATMRLRKMLQLRIRFLHNVSRHRHQVNDEIYGQLRPLYMPRRERYLARESRVFQRVLDDGAVQGEFRVERAAGVARLLLMATNAFLPFALSPQQLRRPKQITAQADKLIDLLLRGLSVARTICPGLKENKEC